MYFKTELWSVLECTALCFLSHLPWFTFLYPWFLFPWAYIPQCNSNTLVFASGSVFWGIQDLKESVCVRAKNVFLTLLDHAVTIIPCLGFIMYVLLVLAYSTTADTISCYFHGCFNEILLKDGYETSNSQSFCPGV